MSKKFSKVASNNTASVEAAQPSVAELMALIQQLKAQNDALTATVKTTVAKSEFVRKSFNHYSKREYNIALANGGKYNSQTYQVDFDDEASWNKFKQQITAQRTKSKIMLRDADLRGINWIKKGEDGETFQVYAYYNSKELYKSSPLLGLITNLFTFKAKPSMDCWHSLPASVFEEFWEGYSTVWSVVTGDYNPKAKKPATGGDDL